MSTSTPARVEVNLACAVRPRDVIADYQGKPFATVIGVMQSPAMPEVVAIYGTLAATAEVIVLAKGTLDSVDLLRPEDGADPEPIVVRSMKKRFGGLVTGDLLFPPYGGAPRYYVLESVTHGDDAVASAKLYNFATGETYDYRCHREDEVLVAAR